MRQALGILLWIVSTLSGVFGAGWFGLAGLGWADGFIKRLSWDESESGIGIAFGVISLVVWLGLLVASVAVMRGGSRSPSRRTRVKSVALTVVSVVTVVALCLLVIGWPEPASEFPTPPWNRA